MSRATWSASRSREARRRAPKAVKAKCLGCGREGWDDVVQLYGGVGCSPACHHRWALGFAADAQENFHADG